MEIWRKYVGNCKTLGRSFRAKITASPEKQNRLGNAVYQITLTF